MGLVQLTARMSEKFCVRWNDYHSNVSKSFSLFRNEEYLHDVTLVSDDHSKIQAHKLVLSACSDYFKDIFKNNQHSHPLLCLDGISSEGLKNIMDYIYNGEVQIHQDYLDRFLNVAQRLNLEGLIGDNSLKENFNENIKDEFFQSLDEDHEMKQILAPEKMSIKGNRKSLTETFAVTTNSKDMTEINEQINQHIEECSDGTYKCTLCGKTSNNNSKKSTQKSNIMSHIETHMQGIQYDCPICSKTFRTKDARRFHTKRYH